MPSCIGGRFYFKGDTHMLLSKKNLYVSDILNLSIYQHFNSPVLGFQFVGTQKFLIDPTDPAYKSIIALSENLTNDELNQYIEIRKNSQDEQIVKMAFKLLKKYPQLLK
jgi:hypothetical protein